MISPQNGHILCPPKVGVRGLNIASSLTNEFVIAAYRRPRFLRNMGGVIFYLRSFSLV